MYRMGLIRIVTHPQTINTERKMDYNDFISKEPIVLEGVLVKEGGKEDIVTLQLHPGLIVEARREHVTTIEEAIDDVTGRTYLQIKIDQDAEITTVFRPRLARLAMGKDGGVPFSLGWDTSTVMPGQVYADIPNQPATDRQNIASSARYASIGERRTRCRHWLFGPVTVDDSAPYSDY